MAQVQVESLLTQIAANTLAGATAANQTTGIATTSRLVSAANSDNATVVKASAGRLFKIDGYNAAASVRWLKLYDKATAPSAADTPRRSIALPASSRFELNFTDLGLAFAAGIGFRLVTGSADADNTAVTAADVLGLNLDYI